jgi:hypothetical protein
MMKRSALIVLFLSLGGCVTHGVWRATGIAATSPDNPNVVVTSDTNYVRLTPVGLQPAIDIEPSPDLAVSFKRALQKYVSSANVRIISAGLTVSTALNRQHVTLAMLVSANGATYQLRHDTDTHHAGWGNKYLAEFPVYLDACAEQLSQRLGASGAGSG